ncbi:MAG: DUF1987 family protein [Sphingobacteriaceae bacterium]|nr:DUF1987 family protein [Sphingobacteriaceae bacterium]
MSNDHLNIGATEDTPEVFLSADGSKMLVSGMSMPENAFEFYDPIEKKSTEVLSKLQNTTTLEIQLSYMNSTSNKQILKLINQIFKIHSALKVIWKYESSDTLIKLKGEEIKSICNSIQIELQEIN